LTEDRQGNLWVGTEEHGMNMLDPESGIFTRYSHRPEEATNLCSNEITAAFCDSTGTVWIGTSQ
jgi:ligand-binding sensor domain-containing protein